MNVRSTARNFYHAFSTAFVLVSACALALTAYWLYIDTSAPVRLIYQHDRFMRSPVSTRDAAKKMSIDEAKPNATVWRWVEWCLDREVHGIFDGVWSDGLIYRESRPAPDTVGCFGKSVAHKVPPSLFVDLLVFTPRLSFRVNPLYTAVVEYPTLALVVRP